MTIGPRKRLIKSGVVVNGGLLSGGILAPNGHIIVQETETWQGGWPLRNNHRTCAGERNEDGNRRPVIDYRCSAYILSSNCHA